MTKTRLVVLASILIVVVACGQPASAAGKTYYVSTSGDDSASGLTEKTAWRTITHAANVAIAGDTVKIKAGTYDDEHAVISNRTGTRASPIVFEGYGGTPELDGLDGTGNGIAVNSSTYIELKNLKVTRYQYGVPVTNATYVTLDGITATILGNRTGSYDGWGIKLDASHHCIVRNCSVTDAGAVNFHVWKSNYNLIENCTSYGIKTDNATDYYMVVQYSHDNIIRNCISKNMHPSSTVHPGHGIGIKDVYYKGKYSGAHSYNNKIINCRTYGHGEHLWVAHGAYNNEFIDCTADNFELNPYHQWNNGFVVRDGAHHNTYKNCRAVGRLQTACSLSDSSEGPSSVQIQHDNIFENCIGEGPFRIAGIFLEDTQNNLFKNCVINDAPYLFRIRNNNTGNTMKNSIVTNITNYKYTYSGATGDLTGTYSNFWSNGFATPSGAGNISKNPLFVNAGKGDYRLKPGSPSPCRGAGEHDIDMGVLEPWSRPIWVVHAGGDWDGPENTIAALKKSVALGAEYAEIDLRVTKDGQVVVIHDETLDRTTNGKGRVKELTYAQIQQYDAGSWFHPEFKDERVPLLSDVLDFARAYHMRLLLHVKEPEACPLLFDLLKKHGMVDNARVYMMAADAAVRNALDPRIKQYPGNLVQPWGYRKGPQIVLDALKNKKSGGALMRSYTCVLEAQKMENDLEIAE